MIANVNSNNVFLQQDSWPSNTARNTFSYLQNGMQSHFYRTFDLSNKQSRLEPGRLCCVGSPALASVLRWLFETLEQLKNAIVDEWCALSQTFTDRRINERRRRLKCIVQQNSRHIEHLFIQLFSRRLYTATIYAHLWSVTCDFFFSRYLVSYSLRLRYTHVRLWYITNFCLLYLL